VSTTAGGQSRAAPKAAPRKITAKLLYNKTKKKQEKK